ncbi:MAG: hypothetical protein Q8K30_01750 [Candidatus Gracilibacteria bacterium]|nr:hypothetical protein [Candidatus Gracilibacteria bacterium]
MTLKEMLNQNFSDPNLITLERYKSAKFAFIIFTFLFFVNFYFVGANFFVDIFSITFGVSYILMLLSLIFYIYFFIKKMLINKPNQLIFIITVLLLTILFVFMLLPMIFKGGIIGIFDLIGMR